MPRVVRRGNQFYFRVAVPLALVERVGQRELKVSLRTCSPSEAKCRGRVLSNAVDVLFARLIRMTKLTQQEVHERIRAYFQDALNWCQEQALFIPTDKALDVAAEIASLGAYEQDLRKQLAALAYPPSVEAEAQSILSDDPTKAVVDQDLMLEDGPIFHRVDRHGRVLNLRLSGEAVCLVVRERVAAAGFDPAAYSGHSLRAGLATSAAQAGVSSLKIRQQTGHASDAMLGRYVRDGELFKENAAGALL
jgi:hypothetical protein